jgi:hypothetical protein
MDIREEYLAGKMERTAEGIYFPKSGVLAQGVFRFNKRGEDEEFSENLVVDEGLDYLLAAAVAASSPISNWYVATFSGDVTVLSTWTAANFVANATEWTTYESATRPAWSRGSVTSGAVDSFVSKAEFKATADSQVIRGAALISVAAKGAISGTLIAASRFPSDKALDTDEILDIGYGLQLTAV